MSERPVYVLDANVFIEAAQRYYAFDLAPGFWQALLDHAKDGRIQSIDRVSVELSTRTPARLGSFGDSGVHAPSLSRNTRREDGCWLQGDA